EHQATHDPLTGLPNRLMFERVVGAMLRNGRELAVLLFDLDRFKEVNDTLGHAAGDALLRDVGERLKVAVPDALCIARLGGDEFTILLTNADAAAATAAAEAARAALLNPVEVQSVPVSVDALVRWNHPVRGFIPPDGFIGVAEQTGIILPLTDWVVSTALAQCRKWLDDGLDMSVSVNVSPRVLRDSTFVDRLVRALAAHRVPAARLTLEITESAIMDDVEHGVDVLWRLRRAGVQ